MAEPWSGPASDGPRVRVATWNMKQAVAPRQPLKALWQWLETEVNPTVAVLTEAKVPADGPPPGWRALWRAGGIGSRRRWGTVIAGSGDVELRPVAVVEPEGIEVDHLWPGTVQAAELHVGGAHWGIVIGLYGLTVDASGTSVGHGRHTTRALLDHLQPLLEREDGGRVVVAGDFNFLPSDLRRIDVASYGLVDLTELTASDREAVATCVDCTQPCRHLWTHRNGTSPNAARQQVDFVLANHRLASETVRVFGGIEAFPDAWTMSDHAPLGVDFDASKQRSVARRSAQVRPLPPRRRARPQMRQ